MRAWTIVVVALAWLPNGGCSSRGAKRDGAADALARDGGETLDGSGDVAPRAFPPDEISGTRVRARHWLVEDGSTVVEGDGVTAVWYDTKLGVTCRWMSMGDGSTYACQPVTAFSVVDNLRVDPQCTSATRVARSRIFAPPSAPSDILGQALREAACRAKPYASGPLSDYALGDAITTTELYDANAGCAAAPLYPGEVVYSVAGAVDPTDLATAHVERYETGHRLSVLQLVSDDGARQRVGWYDNVLGAACTVGLASDGKMRCLPSGPSAGEIFFADAAGTLPVAMAAPPTKPDTPSAFVTETSLAGPSACGSGPTRVFRVGAAQTGDVYAEAGGEPLDASVVPAGLYRVTEISPEAMDAFEPKTLGARLQIAALADADGALDVPPFGAPAFGAVGAAFIEGLTDTALQQPCRFLPSSDGVVRCLPLWSEQIMGLNCDRNVAVQRQPSTTCPGDPRATFTAAWRGGACSGGYELSALGAAIPPNSGRVGDCLVGGADPTVSYYEVGAAAPASTFAAATIVTE